MYAAGTGVLQNNKAALKWYTLAAENGRAKTQAHLGIMYFLGKGVLEDFVRAHMWFNIATLNGEDPKFRNIAAKKMTSHQLEEAQRLAREWVKEHNG